MDTPATIEPNGEIDGKSEIDDSTRNEEVPSGGTTGDLPPLDQVQSDSDQSPDDGSGEQDPLTTPDAPPEDADQATGDTTPPDAPPPHPVGVDNPELQSRGDCKIMSRRVALKSDPAGLDSSQDETGE